VGFHIGSVVAGVIGIRKFIYDVWGDTVNTASRLESHGLPGHIQVSETVYERLKDAFEFEPRGVIELKGRGNTHAYFLKGPIAIRGTPAGEQAKQSTTEVRHAGC
jgi:class 3 adenylate cyclase